MEQLKGKKGISTLEKEGYKIKTTPEQKAQRTLVVRRIDEYIGKYTQEEIKTELKLKNNLQKIEEIIKIRDHRILNTMLYILCRDYTNIFKIICEDTETANHIMEKGIVMFNMSISNTQIEREEFINTKICFTCYQIDQHFTNECPTPNIIVCSKCANQGHKYLEFWESTEKCINCHRPQQIMAMSYPNKKEAIKKLREQRKAERINRTSYTPVTGNISYARMTQQNRNIENTQTAPTSNEWIKALICLEYAHSMNMAFPGTFNKEFESVLKLNNIPVIKTREITEAESETVLRAMNRLQKPIPETETTETETTETETTVIQPLLETPLPIQKLTEIVTENEILWE